MNKFQFSIIFSRRKALFPFQIFVFFPKFKFKARNVLFSLNESRRVVAIIWGKKKNKTC